MESKSEEQKEMPALDKMYEEYLEEVRARRQEESKNISAMLDDLVKEYDSKL